MFSFILSGTLSFAQVGVHTDYPDASSAMEIYATNKGLLIPRVTLTSDLSDPSPVTSPATGLLVFNSGSNQPQGFYYWTGSAWATLGGGSSGGSDYWSLTGNSGTTAGTNFIGTTDEEDLTLHTNDSERMRITAEGNVVVATSAPYHAEDVFTVEGKPGMDYAINAFSTYVGIYTKADYSGIYSSGGRYGLVAILDTANGYGVYARNSNSSGYGLASAGSSYAVTLITGRSAGITSAGYDGAFVFGKNTNGYGIIATGSASSPLTISGHSSGVASSGYDGIISIGRNGSGRGIISVGSAIGSPSISGESEGGAFTGYHGVYAKGANAQGIGVIGLGSNVSTYSLITGGLGGSFSGNYGIYGKGLNTEGIGVLGVGSNGSAYYAITGGSGGSFTGYHGILGVGVNETDGTGVIGAGNNSGYSYMPNGSGGAFTGLNVGMAAWGNSSSSGVGVIGAGNNQSAWFPSNGCGGAFTGSDGVFGKATSASGTAFIGIGNNISTPNVYTDGSGGAFTGTMAGAVGWGMDATYGVGIIGIGNNVTVGLPANGAGGVFTGQTGGVYGTCIDSGNDSYGGYFSNGGVAYAYVGGRFSNKNYKIYGSGTVSTIVKNRQGGLITLNCPEAPEVVFQDYGTGQLVDGFAHIEIDPDLAININVSEDHPIKVYITPEGDCKGVYVANKSADGFDVVELQGGTSDVPFSWQIVATRANERTRLKDGTMQLTDYSQRFSPAPGPVESMTQSPATMVKKYKVRRDEKINSSDQDRKTDRSVKEKILKVQETSATEINNDPHGRR